MVALLIARQIPSSYRYEDGELLVIAKGPGFKTTPPERISRTGAINWRTG
jgi:hypothetical protein